MRDYLTFCPSCREPQQKIRRTARIVRIYTCPACKYDQYGENCPKYCANCGTRYDKYWPRRKLDHMTERVPDSEICPKCREELAPVETIGKEGAMFRCSSCGTVGAIKRNDVTDNLRALKKVPFGRVLFLSLPRCVSCQKG